MTDIRRSPRASGTVGAATRAFATAALLTFGATCAFAAGSDGTPAKDANAKPAAQAAAAKTPAATQQAAKTEAKAAPAKTPAKGEVAAKAGAGAPVKTVAVGTATAKDARPAAATTSGSHAVQTAPAAAKVAAKPAAARATHVASAPGTAVQAAQPKEDAVTYHYNALGRRDPFNPLVDGFIPADQGGAAPPDIGGLKVVGIVWGADDKFALVEDPRGNSMVLRRGDKVMNGVVEGLKRESMIVKITVDGQSQSVEIPLMRKGDDHDNR